MFTAPNVAAPLTRTQLGQRGLWALVGVCVGCSPTSFALRAHDAERAVQAAEDADAARHAPYEIVLSRLYLDKAREEAREAHYALALELADRAARSALRARALSRARASGDE